MGFHVHVPTLQQLSMPGSWDAALGVPVAILMAVVIGLYIAMTLLFSGFMGGHRDNAGWVLINFCLGLALSLFTLAASGSWFAGCGVAALCFFALRALRVAAGN